MNYTVVLQDNTKEYHLQLKDAIKSVQKNGGSLYDNYDRLIVRFNVSR